MSISFLLEEDNDTLPKPYVDLKQKVIRQSLYRQQSRMDAQSELLMKITKEYYELLPVAEQKIVDVLVATHEAVCHDKYELAIDILTRHYPIIEQNELFNTYDLLVIQLLFICFSAEKFGKRATMSEKFLYPLLHQFEYIESVEEAVLAIAILLNAMSVFYEEKKFVLMKSCIDSTQILMKQAEDYQRKPIVDMVDGKYYLYHKKDIDKAKQKFVDASDLARLMGDSFLASRILEEWEEDLSIFSET